MTTQSAGVFIQQLRESRLLDQAKIDELSRELSQATDGQQLAAPALAAGLVQIGWLTPAQAQQLLGGDGAQPVPVAAVAVEVPAGGEAVPMAVVWEQPGPRLPPAAAFLELLRESRVLEPGKLEELARTPEAGTVDAPTLGQCLVQLGWLTAYQLEELFAGRGGELAVGPYIIMDRLSENSPPGAYKARHPERQPRVALKIIPRQRLGNDALSRRFFQELQAAMHLAHPNLARVVGLDLIADQHVYGRDYVEGTDLARLVKEAGPLTLVQACDYVHQAALGLQHAHEHGLAHRHVQASNLVLAQDSGPVGTASPSDEPAAPPASGAVLKVVDIGLGSLQEPGGALEASPTNGPLFALPAFEPGEEPALTADPAHTRKDIQDLGCTFIFLLTGQPPEAASAEQIPAAAHHLLTKMLAQPPEPCFASMTEFAQAIEEFVEGGMVAPPLEPAPSPEPALAESAPALHELPKAEAIALPAGQESAAAIPVVVAPALAHAAPEAPPASPAPEPAPAPATEAPKPETPLAQVVEAVTEPIAKTEPAAPVKPEDSPFAPAALSGGAVAEMAAPPAEESITFPIRTDEPSAPTRRATGAKRPWTTKDILILVGGALLHVIAAVILVIIIYRWSSSESTPPRRVPPPPPGPGENKGKPKMGWRKPDVADGLQS